MRQKMQSTFKDGNGRVVGSATTANGVAGNIAVYLAGTTTVASVYTASSGGTAVNSVSTDTHGYFYFWVDPKDYGTAQLFKIVLSHSDFESKTYDNLKIFPDDLSRFIVDSTETDQGAAGNGFSVKDLVDSIGSKSATIIFAHNSNAATTTYTFSTSETIPSNIKVVIEKGAILSIANTKTLTIVGPPEIGLYQVFSGNGKVTGLKYANPQMFGVNTTPGTTDMRVAIQAAADALTTGAGVLDLNTDSYRISKVQGTNDSWGVKITNSGVRVKGDGAILRRAAGISTYALAHPIILVGTPDSNVAAATENVTIEGITFVGENTRHTTSGSYLHDGRYAIEVKNAKGVKIRGNRFTAIDSSAIFFQAPATYDYVNSANYNTTKVYNVNIESNDFIATAHAVPGRALIHAITADADDIRVVDNYFEWCDDAVAMVTTYDDLNDVETDTYTDSNLGVAVKRVGRGLVIKGNNILNSSEHTFYINSIDVAITGNTIRSDDFTNCIGGDIKISARNATVSGNTIIVNGTAIAIQEPAFNVTVSGNVIYSNGIWAGGVIEVSTVNLSSFIDNRSDYLGSYYPMSNISIVGNSVILPTAANSAGQGIAIRIYSASSDANYPEGQIRGVTISGNSIKNHRTGIYIINQLIKNVVISGNTFDAKPFVSAAFAAGTTLNTQAVIMVNRLNTVNVLRDVSFVGNTVYGSTYLFATNDDSASNVYIPEVINDNIFSYIKTFSMNDFRDLTISYNSFRGNVGVFFLDRTALWLNKYGVDNELGNGADDVSFRTRAASHNYGAAAAAWNLSIQENLADDIVVTNASGAVNAILPSCIRGHVYNILNTSGYVLTFKVTGQTGGTIANGKLATYVAGAADVFESWEQP